MAAVCLSLQVIWGLIWVIVNYVLMNRLSCRHGNGGGEIVLTAQMAVFYPPGRRSHTLITLPPFSTSCRLEVCSLNIWFVLQLWGFVLVFMLFFYSVDVLNCVRTNTSNLCTAVRTTIAFPQSSLRDSSPKNENSVIIYSPSSSSKPVWMSLFCRTQRKIFWRKFVTRLFWGTIDFHSRKKILWKSMVPQNCSVSHILQNIFLCVQQNKHIHATIRKSGIWGCQKI